MLNKSIYINKIKVFSQRNGPNFTLQYSLGVCEAIGAKNISDKNKLNKG